MSSALLAKRYPDPVDAERLRPDEGDAVPARVGALPTLTPRGQSLLRIANRRKPGWAAE